MGCTELYYINIVEQDHRGIKRVTKHMLVFKSIHAASITLVGIELVRMIKKGLFNQQDESTLNPTEIFHSLA